MFNSFGHVEEVGHRLLVIKVNGCELEILQFWQNHGHLCLFRKNAQLSEHVANGGNNGDKYW